MTENEISYIIRGAAFIVHKNLGPGLLESVYEFALAHEIRKKGLKVKVQVAVPLIYDNIRLDKAFRLDIIVEEKVIVEIKSVEHLNKVCFKQLLTYLKLSDKRLGFLINFNVPILEDKKSIIRVVNGLY